MNNFLNRLFANNSNNLGVPAKSKARKRNRSCRIEELEHRDMLSVTPWSFAGDFADTPANSYIEASESTSLPDAGAPASTLALLQALDVLDPADASNRTGEEYSPNLTGNARCVDTLSMKTEAIQSDSAGELYTELSLAGKTKWVGVIPVSADKAGEVVTIGIQFTNSKGNVSYSVIKTTVLSSTSATSYDGACVQFNLPSKNGNFTAYVMEGKVSSGDFKKSIGTIESKAFTSASGTMSAAPKVKALKTESTFDSVSFTCSGINLSDVSSFLVQGKLSGHKQITTYIVVSDGRLVDMEGKDTGMRLSISENVVTISGLSEKSANSFRLLPITEGSANLAFSNNVSIKTTAFLTKPKYSKLNASYNASAQVAQFAFDCGVNLTDTTKITNVNIPFTVSGKGTGMAWESSRRVKGTWAMTASGTIVNGTAYVTATIHVKDPYSPRSYGDGVFTCELPVELIWDDALKLNVIKADLSGVQSLLRNEGVSSASGSVKVTLSGITGIAVSNVVWEDWIPPVMAASSPAPVGNNPFAPSYPDGTRLNILAINTNSDGSTTITYSDGRKINVPPATGKPAPGKEAGGVMAWTGKVISPAVQYTMT